MNLIDHLSKTADIEILYHGKEDQISYHTQFDYVLALNFADGEKLTVNSKGDFVTDICPDLDGLSIEEHQEAIKSILKQKLVKRLVEMQ